MFLSRQSMRFDHWPLIGDNLDFVTVYLPFMALFAAAVFLWQVWGERRFGNLGFLPRLGVGVVFMFGGFFLMYGHHEAIGAFLVVMGIGVVPPILKEDS
jgi:hypothetical protein